MADSKITGLAALTTADPANDMLPIVDVSDNSMAASGTTKRISINNILACSPSATLASATVTGDLTVDTNVLKVDSTNNRVGIGTATPNWLLTASGSSPEFVMIDSGANGTRLYTKTTNTAVFIGANYSTSAVPINFTLDGGSSNAMTLNANGLGVGVSPLAKLHVEGGGAQGRFSVASTTDGRHEYFRNGVIEGIVGWDANVFKMFAFQSGGKLEFYTGGSNLRATIDATGNVGIGVTPSLWNSNYNGLDIGQNGCIAGRVGSSNTIDIISNGFRNSAGNYVYKLATSNTACRYQLDGSTGSHIWYSGAPGTAGNTIAGFSTALMTLDASGNLILQSPSSPPTLGTNGQLTVNATSNTNLRFSYRGSDGTTRVANITLA